MIGLAWEGVGWEAAWDAMTRLFEKGFVPHELSPRKESNTARHDVGSLLVIVASCCISDVHREHARNSRVECSCGSFVFFNENETSNINDVSDKLVNSPRLCS